MILATICLLSTTSILVGKNLETPVWIAICQFISFVPIILFYVGPMQVLALIFGETVANLCSWCTILTNNIKSGNDLLKSMDNCKSLIGLLNNTSQLFAKPMAYMVIVLMIGSICHIYRSIVSPLGCLIFQNGTIMFSYLVIWDVAL
jgi:hypothetical protein